MTSVRVIVPTITPQSIAEAIPWLGELSNAGVDVTVAANSARCANLHYPDSFEISTSGVNDGFASSVTRALSETIPDVVVLANDDLSLSVADATALVEDILHEFVDGARLVRFFTDEHSSRVPGIRNVFENVSLLSSIYSRLPHSSSGFRNQTDEELKRGRYCSFALVAVSGQVWSELSGLSCEFPFCYEDADFCRRAWELGNVRFTRHDTGIRHRHSESSSSHVDAVLPVVIYSASMYLRRIGLRNGWERPLLGFALAVRLLLAPFARASKRKHLRGIIRSLRWVVAGGPNPRLPDYDAL